MDTVEILRQRDQLLEAADQCLHTGFEAARQIVLRPGGFDTLVDLGGILLGSTGQDVTDLLKRHPQLCTPLFRSLALAGWGRFVQITLEDASRELEAPNA